MNPYRPHQTSAVALKSPSPDKNAAVGQAAFPAPVYKPSLSSSSAFLPSGEATSSSLSALVSPRRHASEGATKSGERPSRITTTFRNLFRSPATPSTSSFLAIDEWLDPTSSPSFSPNKTSAASPHPAPAVRTSRSPRQKRPRTAPEQGARREPGTFALFIPPKQTIRQGSLSSVVELNEEKHTPPRRRASLETLQASVKTSLAVLSTSTSSPALAQDPLLPAHATTARRSPPPVALPHSHLLPSPPSLPSPSSPTGPTAMSAFFSPSRPAHHASHPPSLNAPNSPPRPPRSRVTGAGNLFSSTTAGSSTSSSSASKLIKRATNRQSRFILGGGGGGGALAHFAPVATEKEGEEGGKAALQREGLKSQESLRREGEDQEEKHGGEAGWYQEYHPPGGLDVQKYARDLPYFVSYSNAASDWDSLRTSALFLGSLHGSPAFPIQLDADGSVTSTVPPPKKVLDIGSGPTPFWLLEMAKTWKETEFVALDAAPSAIAPGLLPPHLEPRISTVQADFKESLPFQDGEFDFVRLAFVNNAMSEQHWAMLIEEAMRVLKPSCFFEVVEQDTAVWRKRKNDDDNIPRSSTDSSDRFSSIDNVFNDVLQDRFINPSPLTIIPSDLAMNASQLRSTGKITFPVLADPPSYDASTASPIPATVSGSDFRQRTMPLERYAPGATAQTPLLETNEVRVLLAAYADKWASSSYGLAHAAVSARTRVRTNSRRSRTSSGPDDLFAAASSTISAATSAAFTKDVQDVEDQVHAWTDDLRERASIAQLLTSRFGWAPTVDNEMLAALEENIPALDSKLRELSQRKAVQDSVFGEVDPELEFRLQQMEFARREAEGELTAVRERLFGPERDEGGTVEGAENILGSMDLQAFVCKAYA